MLSGSPPPCSEVLNVQSRPIRNLTPNTQRVYVAQVVRFACHFGKSPDLLGPPEIRIYRALMKGGRFAADSTLEQSGFEL
jgi:hypothetical protein